MASLRFKPFMFLVILFGMYPGMDSVGRCPQSEGWHELGNGKCFKIFTDLKDYQSARSACQDVQQQSSASIKFADLVSMRLQDEETIINRYNSLVPTPTNGADEYVWIRLTSEILGRAKFECPDQSGNENDPNQEKAVALHIGTEGHEYVIVDAAMKYRSVCELEIQPTS